MRVDPLRPCTSPSRLPGAVFFAGGRGWRTGASVSTPSTAAPPSASAPSPPTGAAGSDARGSAVPSSGLAGGAAAVTAPASRCFAGALAVFLAARLRGGAVAAGAWNTTAAVAGAAVISAVFLARDFVVLRAPVAQVLRPSYGSA